MDQGSAQSLPIESLQSLEERSVGNPYGSVPLVGFAPVDLRSWEEPEGLSLDMAHDLLSVEQPI